MTRHHQELFILIWKAITNEACLTIFSEFGDWGINFQSQALKFYDFKHMTVNIPSFLMDQKRFITIKLMLWQKVLFHLLNCFRSFFKSFIFVLSWLDQSPFLLWFKWIQDPPLTLLLDFLDHNHEWISQKRLLNLTHVKIEVSIFQSTMKEQFLELK